MRKKLTLDDLQVESFETTGETPARGTVFGAQTEAFFSCVSDCGDPCGTGGTGGTGGETNECPGPSDEPCTWYQVFTCESNQVAYPSQCTGCGVDCNPTFDYCASGPGYHC
jgi:hypothetical protein